MQVTDKAVEAAFASLLEGGVGRMLHLTHEDLWAALEAAAPHMRAGKVIPTEAVEAECICGPVQTRRGN